MARSSSQALRELDSTAMAPITARRAIKRIRKICRRRLRRNGLVSLLVLFPSLVIGLIILWGDNRFVPYVWEGARSILLAFWVVSTICMIVTWIGAGISSIEQVRVLNRLNREEGRIEL